MLTLALSRQADRQARPGTVFQNFDKISGAWLLSLPGPDTGLSSAVFSEAMAAHLCLPSPAVTAGGWVGKCTVRGGAVIDKFGDAIMCCKYLPGDTWRARHDTGKLAIVSECIDAKLVHDCEVYGLFADLIPAHAAAQGEDLEWGRARQGLIPDFRMRLPDPGGLTQTEEQMVCPTCISRNLPFLMPDSMALRLTRQVPWSGSLKALAG